MEKALALAFKDAVGVLTHDGDDEVGHSGSVPAGSADNDAAADLR
jgi:hypothetical protein